MTGLDVLKGIKLPEGLFAVGEFRGIEQRPSNGNTYYKLKVLIGDNVQKFDIKPEVYGALKDTAVGSKTVVQYYSFTGKFGVNHICLNALIA